MSKETTPALPRGRASAYLLGVRCVCCIRCVCTKSSAGWSTYCRRFPAASEFCYWTSKCVLDTACITDPSSTSVRLVRVLPSDEQVRSRPARHRLMATARQTTTQTVAKTCDRRTAILASRPHCIQHNTKTLSRGQLQHFTVCPMQCTCIRQNMKSRKRPSVRPASLDKILTLFMDRSSPNLEHSFPLSYRSKAFL